MVLADRGSQTNVAGHGSDEGGSGAPVRGPKTGRAGRTNPAPPAHGSSGPGYWPLIAVIAMIVATAGWTTVAVMAITGGGNGSAAIASPSDDAEASFDDSGTDVSDAPVEVLHEAIELEALLPTEAAGTPLATQSWTGDTLLGDGGPWSASIAAYLTSVGKTPADLSAAQALDPNETIDHSVGVFRVAGIPIGDLRDAFVDAWKIDYPDLVTTTITLDGIEVQKSDFGQDAINSYWYEHDGLLFDVETSDEAVATELLKAIRDGETAPAASSGPSAPAASPSPS
jgi:hypothetical protein